MSKHPIYEILISVCSSYNGATHAREIMKFEADAWRIRNIVIVCFDGVELKIIFVLMELFSYLNILNQ